MEGKVGPRTRTMGGGQRNLGRVGRIGGVCGGERERRYLPLFASVGFLGDDRVVAGNGSHS